jgi:serine/threonine protein kinase
VRAANPTLCLEWKAAIIGVIKAVSDLNSTVCPKTEEVFVLPKRYVIKKKLGQGAYGLVAGGVDEQQGRQVAIKKVRNAFEERILRVEM